MEKCRADSFRPWIHKFGREIIVHSVRCVLFLLSGVDSCFLCFACVMPYYSEITLRITAVSPYSVCSLKQ